MHSIASVRSSSGAADYFANDNYYTADEHAEAGVWGGEGARALGLEGQVERDQFEPPGETHTLVVDPDVDEMITMFQVNGAMIYVDPDGKCVGYDDVFTRIDKCRAHYRGNGLGEGYIDQFIR